MSIVAMKRKSRKMNRPISGGGNGFSLYGAHSTTTMSTSGLMASKIKRKPIYVAKYNGDGDAPYESQGKYIYDLAKAAENRVKKMTDAGTATCANNECNRGKVPTLTKSDQRVDNIPGGQHFIKAHKQGLVATRYIHQ